MERQLFGRMHSIFSLPETSLVSLKQICQVSTNSGHLWNFHHANKDITLYCLKLHKIHWNSMIFGSFPNCMDGFRARSGCYKAFLQNFYSSIQIIFQIKCSSSWKFFNIYLQMWNLCRYHFLPFENTRSISYTKLTLASRMEFLG